MKKHKQTYIGKPIQNASRKKADRVKNIRFLSFIVLAIVFIVALVYLITNLIRDRHSQEVEQELQEIVQSATIFDPYGFPVAGESAYGLVFLNHNTLRDSEISILPQYVSLYNQNSDMIGWLKIDDTLIDYPVMQTMEDEEYYLYRGFDKAENNCGCLIMDTDSSVGVGNLEEGYALGDIPSTNLIIHGHTMKTGEMFGDLQLYKSEDYGKEHSIIKFDSLYEQREYKLISVFYSKVYYEDEDVFKYYKFFNANSIEEFDDWYRNIKSLSLYDTGVEATFGDEFITLSCCSYQEENGRFVVIGKRLK